MKFIGHLASSVFAGLVIALGSAVFYFAEQGTFAAVVSSIGILAVLAFDLSLFTEKAEKLFAGKRKFEQQLARAFSSLIGNLLGSIGGGLLLGCVTDVPAVSFPTDMDSILHLVIGSIFGGMLLYIAVHGYRRLSDDFSGCLAIVFSVALLHLCGFSFAVTEASRYAAAFAFHWKAAVYLLLSALGNFAGVLFLAWLHYMRGFDAREEKKHRHRRHSEEE